MDSEFRFGLESISEIRYNRGNFPYHCRCEISKVRRERKRYPRHLRRYDVQDWRSFWILDGPTEGRKAQALRKSCKKRRRRINGVTRLLPSRSFVRASTFTCVHAWSSAPCTKDRVWHHTHGHQSGRTSDKHIRTVLAEGSSLPRVTVPIDRPM